MRDSSGNIMSDASLSDAALISLMWVSTFFSRFPRIELDWAAAMMVCGIDVLDI